MEAKEGAEPAETYAYDEVGNRISSSKEASYTYDANNQLLAVGDTSYSYDKNGNTIQQTTKGNNTQFEYNIENRLTQVSKDGVETKYYYDPFGRRLSKEVNGKRTWFAYSEEGLVAEYDEKGTLLTSYTWKPGDHWSTDPVMLSKAGKHYYYHNDHLGAPQTLTNSTGKVVWKAKYDAFGAVEVVTNEVENNLRLPGQYFDKETGLYYNWHRYYEPKTGRYLSADPIGLLGGINMFAYAANDPLLKIDPYGLDWTIRVTGGIKIVLGIVMDVGGVVLVGGGGLTEGVSLGTTSVVSIPAIVAGGALWVYGTDQINTGLYELWNGQSQLSLTEQTIIVLDEFDREYDITGQLINAEMTLGPGYGTVFASGTLSISRILRASSTASKMRICKDGQSILVNTLNNEHGYILVTRGKWVKPTGLRLPKNGTWSGTKGNSIFTPKHPGNLGLKPGDTITFRRGQPDFSPYSIKNYNVKNLTGVHKVDMPLIHAHIAKQKKWLKKNGEPNASRARKWLKQQGLTPHHAGKTLVNLVPTEIHEGIKHTGSAYYLRNDLWK